MNICIVNIHENNPYIGGVERVSFELGHDWIKKGHNVFFLSQYKSTIKKSYQSLCKELFLQQPLTHHKFSYFATIFTILPGT